MKPHHLYTLIAVLLLLSIPDSAWPIDATLLYGIKGAFALAFIIEASIGYLAPAPKRGRPPKAQETVTAKPEQMEEQQVAAALAEIASVLRQENEPVSNPAPYSTVTVTARPKPPQVAASQAPQPINHAAMDTPAKPQPKKRGRPAKNFKADYTNNSYASRNP